MKKDSLESLAVVEISMAKVNSFPLYPQNKIIFII